MDGPLGILDAAAPAQSGNPWESFLLFWGKLLLLAFAALALTSLALNSMAARAQLARLRRSMCGKEAWINGEAAIVCE
jgi:hypothetical protein